MIFKYIDWVHDRVTMYRLMLYYLIFLIGAAAGLAALGYLHYSPYAIILSSVYLVSICWISNEVFAYAFDAPTNKESSLITALILALIIPPASTLSGALFLTAAGGLAIASKYMLAIGRKHIFNPAAIAVALTSLGAGQAANWWVGSASMLPFVVIGGLSMTRKIRRWQMISSFLAAAYAGTAFYTLLSHGNVIANLSHVTLHSSLFFLTFVMLTEPATSPAAAGKQRWYGALVGLLFPPQVHVATLYSTPELALLAGNVFTRVIEPKVKLFPSLARKTKLAPDIAEFVFTPEEDFNYKPGQYMEWTLPHSHSDSRGDRRYLTLASSPTEPEIRLGIRFYPDGSSYKKAMLKLDADSEIVASQLAGDFVLPDDKDRKLAFITGGIGITPYRSMIKYLLDSDERRNIVMLYSAATADRIVYRDVFEEARRRLGVHIVYCLTGKGRALPEDDNYRSGYITSDMIKREMPDYKDRLFYVSGSQSMVNGIKKNLRELGVHHSHIKTDFFPGYA